MVAVFDEMNRAYPVDIDRREALATPGRNGNSFPAGPHPSGGRPELPVESVAPVDRADDRVNRDRAQAETPATCPAQGGGHVIEEEDRLAATLYLGDQCPQLLAPPCLREVGLGVL